jgi:hypothetical protein
MELNGLPKIDRSVFIVSSLQSASDEKLYWLSKTPLERMAAIEQMRQIIYGYDPSTERIQRIFEVVQRKSYRS